MKCSLRAIASVLVAATVVFRAEPALAEPANESERASVQLSLEDVLTSVRERHPLLRAAAQEQAVAQADVLSAEGAFDPSLRARATSMPYAPYPNERIDILAEQPTALWGARLFGGWRYGRGSFAVYDGKLETSTLGEARLGAAIPILRDGPIDRRRAGTRKAELGTLVARANVDQQRLEALRSASLRYWDWVASGRKLAIARDMLAIAVARDAGLASRVARGDLPRFERTENQRVIFQRSAAVAAAERAFQNASIELSMFFRAGDGSPVLADESRVPRAIEEPHSSPFDRERAERAALAQRPELRRLGAASDQARVDRDLARNQQKLAMNLSGAVSKDFGEFANQEKRLKPEVEVGLLLDVPVLNRVQEGRERSAEATIARIREQTRFTQDRIVADVRDAASAADMARERLGATRREVEVSRSLVEAERQRFELGEGTLLLVNLRESALAEARSREVDVLADYQKALANQKAATAESLRSARFDP